MNEELCVLPVGEAGRILDRLLLLYMNPVMQSHLVALRRGRPSRMLRTLCRMVWK